jgi:hypothetical protein
VCTIASFVQHRILFRHDDKAYLVHTATQVALVGLAFLALAMCGALPLVATILFGSPAGALTAGATALAFGALWFALPMRHARLRGRSGEGGRGPE